MRNFSYINREYVNPVNLEALSKGYDILEQGHKDAIKASSDLQMAMANLDINEAEDEWRQAKVNEIQQIVDDNTIYGNSYAALDKLIAAQGDIMSDQGLIGRVKAQKEFKDFQTRINNDNSLPQDYKDYFLANNPYYYKDKVDANTGKVIGGTTWTPTKSPTKIIPLNEIMNQGLKWAAEESGGGTITRWLDKNGNITTDPTQAFDGQVFDSTTGEWRRLTKEKIWQGIRAAINTTPGAKESLQQDYDVALWNYNNQVNENNGYPIISDITDDQGVVLSPEQYLFKRVDPMTQVAAYNNSKNHTTYGNGLASYIAANTQLANAQQASNLMMAEAQMSGRNTPVEIELNRASNYLSIRDNAAESLQTLFQKYTGKALKIPGDTMIDINATLANINSTITPEETFQLRTLAKAYNEAYKNIKAYRDAVTNEEDRINFDFANRIQAGGKLINSTNGGSEYDDKVISYINDIYSSNTENMKIEFDNDSFNIFTNIVNGGKLNGYQQLGISIDNGVVTIPKSAMNTIPLISSILRQTIDERNSGFFNTLFSIPKAIVKIKRYDRDDNEIIDKFSSYKNSFDEAGRIYDKANDISKEITKKYNINPTKAILSSLNFEGKSFTEGTLLDQYNKGLIDQQQYNNNLKYYSDSFDRILSNTDFSQMDMYLMGDNNVKERVVDSGKRFDYGSQILLAVKDKRVTITPTIVPGSIDPMSGAPIGGYNITVIPKADDKGNPKGEEMRFYIPGLINETASQMMLADPTVQAFNTVSITGGTKSTQFITDTNLNPVLGRITITGLGNNQFLLNYSGVQKVVDTDNAVLLTTAVNNYNAVKNRFLSTSTQLDDRMRSTIADAAIKIGTIMELNPEAVLDKLLEDINK